MSVPAYRAVRRRRPQQTVLCDQPDLELEYGDGHLREERVGARHVYGLRVDEGDIDYGQGAAIIRAGAAISRAAPITTGTVAIGSAIRTAPVTRVASAGATIIRAAPTTIGSITATPIATVDSAAFAPLAALCRNLWRPQFGSSDHT